MVRGQYSTKQKDLILNIISQIHHEFSVKEIFDQIPNISITTIYRTLERLEKDNIVSKVIGVDGNSYYQYLGNCACDHFYLQCEKCGILTHVECNFINKLSKHIIQDHMFHLNKNHILIQGICKQCYKGENNI